MRVPGRSRRPIPAKNLAEPWEAIGPAARLAFGRIGDLEDDPDDPEHVLAEAAQLLALGEMDRAQYDSIRSEFERAQFGRLREYSISYYELLCSERARANSLTSVPGGAVSRRNDPEAGLLGCGRVIPE